MKRPAFYLLMLPVTVLTLTAALMAVLSVIDELVHGNWLPAVFVAGVVSIVMMLAALMFSEDDES